MEDCTLLVGMPWKEAVADGRRTQNRLPCWSCCCTEDYDDDQYDFMETIKEMILGEKPPRLDAVVLKKAPENT